MGVSVWIQTELKCRNTNVKRGVWIGSLCVRDAGGSFIWSRLLRIHSPLSTHLFQTNDHWPAEIACQLLLFHSPPHHFEGLECTTTATKTLCRLRTRDVQKINLSFTEAVKTRTSAIVYLDKRLSYNKLHHLCICISGNYYSNGKRTYIRYISINANCLH